MLWLSRPPYLRWVGAGVVVVLALYGRLAPVPTEPRPFAARPITVGEQITSTDVEMRDVPIGLLPPVQLPVVADRPVAVGEPILPPGRTVSVPENWWALELDVPPGAAPGAPARLVTSGTETTVVPGLVVGVTGTADVFGGGLRALVAVPAEMVGIVAAAAVEQRLAVLLDARSIVDHASTGLD